MPAHPAHAQDAGLSFLRIGTNAAAIAVGDAYVAYSRDAFSTYWNPAGLAAASSNSAALSHHIWVADIRTYSLTSRFRAGTNGALGLFVTGLSSGDLEARDGPGEADGFFSAQYLNLGAAYGRRLGPLRAGLTAKYLAERIYASEADGFALDFGLQLDLLRGGLQLGAAFQNVGKMDQLADVSTPLPRMLRVGAALFPFRILTENDGRPLLNTFLTGEVSHVFTAEETRFHLGVAAEVLDLVMVRAGYITNDTLRRFSFGGGLGYESLQVDYAFLPFQDFGTPGHVLTLLYFW